jgi:WD40 repeat protein
MSAIDGVASADWPFIGLRPFEWADSPFFFGREDSVAIVGELVRASGFVSIVGSSGSGKSSLVSAGLLPLLSARKDETWRIEIMRPGKSPINALTKAISKLRGADDLSQAWEERIRFCLRSSQFGVAEAISLFPAERRAERFLIVIDQFEELFRFAAVRDSQDRRSAGNARNRDDATAFVRLLLAAGEVASIDVHIVITMRSDFIGDCAQFHALPEAVTRRQYLAPGLTRDQRASAISGPLALAGAAIDPQLVQLVLNDTIDEVDQLPITQHVMMCCWQSAVARADGGPVKIEMIDYLSVGGVSKALSNHANRVLATIDVKTSDETHDPPGPLLVKRMFQALTDVDFNGRATRRPVTFGDLARYVASSDGDVDATKASLRAIVKRLAAPDCSFLRAPVGDELNDHSIIDIGHEALIRGWDKLKGLGDADWIREEQDASERYRDLVRRAKGNGTIAGAELPIYESWWADRRPSKTWAKRFESPREEHSYLAEAEDVILRSRAAAKEIEETKSRVDRAEKATLEAAAAAAIAREAEQRAKAEKAEARVHRQRSTSYAIMAVAFVCVLAVSLGYYFFRVETQTRQTLLTIEAGESILNASLLVGAADAVNLLVNAPTSPWSKDYVKRVQEALGSLREIRRIDKLSDPKVNSTNPSGAVANVTFNPKLPILVTSSLGTATAHVLGYKDHGEQVSWLGDLPPPHFASGWMTLRWSPDGSKLYFGAGSHGEILTPCSIKEFREHLSACQGKTEDITVDLDGAPQPGFATWSPDGKLVAVSGFQGPPQLWDAETGARKNIAAPPGGQDLALTSVAFSATGIAFAEGASSGAISLLDAKSGKLIQSYALPGQRTGPESLLFNPTNDRQLLAVYQAGPAILWTLPDKNPSAARVALTSGETPMVMQAAFDPKGAFALTAANDGTIRLYKLGGTAAALRPIKLLGHRRAVFALDVAPDGTIASGSADGTLRLWRVDSALERAQPRRAGEANADWLARLGRDNLPFANFGDDRIKLSDAITCAWAGTCPTSRE